jgi:hypothetical protein
MHSYLSQGEGTLNSFTIRKLRYRWGKFSSSPPPCSAQGDHFRCLKELFTWLLQVEQLLPHFSLQCEHFLDSYSDLHYL